MQKLQKKDEAPPVPLLQPPKRAAQTGKVDPVATSLCVPHYSLSKLMGVGIFVKCEVKSQFNTPNRWDGYYSSRATSRKPLICEQVLVVS